MQDFASNKIDQPFVFNILRGRMQGGDFPLS
jgi:hypothetical protein